MKKTDSHASMIRVFCAVELPPDVRAEAARYIARLRETAPHVRASWDREEKLHLTLKFLGDIEEARVEALANACVRAASNAEPFELIIRGTGRFPPRGLARVLWLGVADPSGRLISLQESLEREAAREGFAREPKKYHPHLTIARLRTTEGAHELSTLHDDMQFETRAFPVNEISIIRSELSPHGSRYTTLRKARMKAEG